MSAIAPTHPALDFWVPSPKCAENSLFVGPTAAWPELVLSLPPINQALQGPSIFRLSAFFPILRNTGELPTFTIDLHFFFYLTSLTQLTLPTRKCIVTAVRVYRSCQSKFLPVRFCCMIIISWPTHRTCLLDQCHGKLPIFLFPPAQMMTTLYILFLVPLILDSGIRLGVNALNFTSDSGYMMLLSTAFDVVNTG